MSELCNHVSRYRDVLGARNGCIACELEERVSELDSLRTRLSIAVEALQKYADKNNWAGGDEYDAPGYDEMWEPHEDGWITAMKALDAMKGGE